MGLASNIFMSIPTSFIMYVLVNKLISQFLLKCDYNNTQQKSFIVEFICGLLLLILAITISTHSVVRYSLFLTSSFMIINSGILNWSCLDEYTKIIFLFILFVGCISYSYKYI